MTVVARSPASIPVAEVRTRLSQSLRLDEVVARGVIDDLRACGSLDQTTDRIVMTADGSTLFQRLDAEVGRLIQQLWAEIDEDDLAAAHRVHATIIERANKLLARPR